MRPTTRQWLALERQTDGGDVSGGQGGTESRRRMQERWRKRMKELDAGKARVTKEEGTTG